MSENQVEQKSDIEKENSDDKKSQTKSSPPIKYEYEILSEDYTNFDLSFKLIVIGDSGVGKSCLTNNAVKNTFEEAYNATVGFEFFTFNVKMCEKVIKLQIWDTCGQENYQSLITNFYRSSSLAILVYSIDKKETFLNLDLWLKELKLNNSPDTKLILVGNKLDLEEKREVKYEEGKKFADDFGFTDFFETSAKTGENIKDMFLKVGIILYEEHQKYKDVDSIDTFGTFKPAYGQLLGRSQKKKNKSGCC